MPEHRFK